jgi:hypothetical protein
MCRCFEPCVLEPQALKSCDANLMPWRSCLGQLPLRMPSLTQALPIRGPGVARRARSAPRPARPPKEGLVTNLAFLAWALRPFWWDFLAPWIALPSCRKTSLPFWPLNPLNSCASHELYHNIPKCPCLKQQVLKCLFIWFIWWKTPRTFEVFMYTPDTFSLPTCIRLYN